MGGAVSRCTGGEPDFWTSHWSVRPYAAATPDAAGFADLFSPADSDALLTGGGLRCPHVRVVRAGRPLARSDYATSRRVGGQTVDDHIDPARAIDAFREGATLVFQSLHTYWPPLGSFCRDLAVELGHPTQANAYLSPLEASGLDLHYDTHDVFVLQAHGAKEWEVFPPVFPRPLPDQHWNRVKPPDALDRPEADGEPVLSVTLRPGDSLYLPRGFLHRARTTSESSLHVTIGVKVRTWFGVAQALVAGAAEDERFRSTVPTETAGTADTASTASTADPLGPTQLDQFRRLLHELVDAADLVDLAAFDPAEQARTAAGHNAGTLLDQLRPVDDATHLRHRHQPALLHLGPEGASGGGGNGEVTVRTPDRTLFLPDRIRPALAFLLDHPRVAVADLTPFLDAPSRVVLARRLVAEGVLAIDDSP